MFLNFFVSVDTKKENLLKVNWKTVFTFEIIFFQNCKINDVLLPLEKKWRPQACARLLNWVWAGAASIKLARHQTGPLHCKVLRHTRCEEKLDRLDEKGAFHHSFRHLQEDCQVSRRTYILQPCPMKWWESQLAKWNVGVLPQFWAFDTLGVARGFWSQQVWSVQGKYTSHFFPQILDWKSFSAIFSLLFSLIFDVQCLSSLISSLQQNVGQSSMTVFKGSETFQMSCR